MFKKFKNLTDLDTEISRVMGALKELDPIADHDDYEIVSGYYEKLVNQRNKLDGQHLSPDAILGAVTKIGCTLLLVWFEKDGVETLKGAWNQALK